MRTVKHKLEKHLWPVLGCHKIPSSNYVYSIECGAEQITKAENAPEKKLGF